MTSAEIRQAFLDYFASHGHEVVASSPLVPANDPTLLFTNAGMVQFKNVFLGVDKRAYQCATSVQRCVRAGGKHNDLENVGYTARHHTFFEMLGNFSFGAYFKRDAIKYAWEFLTQTMVLEADRLWVTVYVDDDEAADIWLKEVGIDPKRLVRISGEDNFWSMGETGPCGPCSEIFYDHGAAVTGGPPGSPEAEGDRYVEIWNLVFMQYNRDKDGKLKPLPKPSVDTGMGLERLAAVKQGVYGNYDIDLFKNLIAATAKLLATDDLSNKSLNVAAPGILASRSISSSLNVIADHIRSCAFLIVDGVNPSNEGRGYVLRRIIRRAIRHGRQLGGDIFFHKLVKPLVKEMGRAYPELEQAQKRVEDELKQEEQRFGETLEQGLKILEQHIASLKGKNKMITGDVVFQLYDTYGFPADLTADIARERGLQIDTVGFEVAMDAQRARGRAASQFVMDDNLKLDNSILTEFSGYSRTEDDAKIVAMFVAAKSVDSLKVGAEAVVVLDQTPFYAESGGQAGDQGRLHSGDAVFNVGDTRKLNSVAWGHIGRLSQGTLKVGDQVHAEVNRILRLATAANHSATHLMHAALKEVLGDHVQQKGSLVDADRLRFDFSHSSPMTHDEMMAIEQRVNLEIRANREVKTQVMNLETAKKSGAMALFGEKYADRVRVVAMGGFSTELCGGTHVTRTGDIGLFRIVAETGIAAGVRRVEAVTGEVAQETTRAESSALLRIAQRVKGVREDVEAKVGQLVERNRSLEKEVDRLKGQLANASSGDLLSSTRDIKGIKVLSARLEGADSKALRTSVDQLKDKLGSAVIVLGSAANGKVVLIAGVTHDLTKKVHAGKLIAMVAEQVGGKGGGRPDMAQAGGSDESGLDAALAAVYDHTEALLS
ncbi:MAG TPA: alanine--tRNA ligase [Acidiferrobacteraceae bacterium]|nr:alanine--tRNA ligase [Acidiferrobacteraceae bacterium]